MASRAKIAMRPREKRRRCQEGQDAVRPDDQENIVAKKTKRADLEEKRPRE
jgi:hypothetical protein